MRPVGRITCSVKTPPVRSISQGPGVAETKMVSGRMASHSSNFKGRLSRQEGSRQPNSESVHLRRKSPRNMPPHCGTVTWLSSTISSALPGRLSYSLGGGSPGQRPVREMAGGRAALRGGLVASGSVHSSRASRDNRDRHRKAVPMHRARLQLRPGWRRRPPGGGIPDSFPCFSYPDHFSKRSRSFLMSFGSNPEA